MARRSAPSPSRWVAKLWRSACGDTRGVPVTCSRRASRRRTARGPRRGPRRVTNSAGAGACAGARASGTAAMRLRSPTSASAWPWRRAERRDPCAPCPGGRGRSARAPVDLDVADVQLAGLRDAQARAVDHLEQGLVQAPAAGVGVGRGPASVEQAADLLLAQERRQPLGALGARRAATGLDRRSRRRTARRKNARSEESLRPMVTASFRPWSEAR